MVTSLLEVNASNIENLKSGELALDTVASANQGFKQVLVLLNFLFGCNQVINDYILP